MTIALITGPLAVSDSPGLATTDSQFTDIATLIQDGKYQEAASLSREVLSKGIYDIRIIGYFSYGYFLEQGVAGLEQLFLALSKLLAEDVAALGPSRNREKHTQTIMNWLMKQLSKKLQYDEQRKTSLWDQWQATVSSEDIEGILDASDALRRALTVDLEEKAGTVLDSLSKVNEWLRHFQGIVYREPEPEPELPEEPEAQVEEGAPHPAPGKSLPTDQGRESATQIRGGGALEVLLRKMEAFDHLINDGKVALAALVAEDINGVVDNFDPRLYFPDLFTRFTLNYVAHINRLSEYQGHGKSAEWKALKELYKVDLDSFVDFPEESITFTLPSAEGAGATGDEYGAPDSGMQGYEDTGAGMTDEGW